MSYFISYARKDEEFTARLAEDLQNCGAETWRDRENIMAGTSWAQAIEQAVREASCILFIATPEAVASRNVLDEINLAADLQKTIIPLLLDTCDLPMRVRQAQWVDFRGDYDIALQKLTDHLGLDRPAPRQIYKPYLDRLFQHSEAIMSQLAASNEGCFTNQQFLKELARRNPIDYIDLLHSTKNYYVQTKPSSEHKWIFNIAHQAIGSRLSRVAQQSGYQPSKAGRTETDIWGNPTNAIRYCRSS